MSADSGSGTTLGAEIIVVLGGGLLHAEDGSIRPSPTTSLRAAAAAELALKHFPKSTVIVSGRGRHADYSDTEAEHMARILEQSKVERSRILLEGESRDTIGNAVLVAGRFLYKEQPRPVIVVTSPFHIERALICFRGALGPDWPISGFTCAAQSNELQRSHEERPGVEWTKNFFRWVKSGELPAIARRLMAVGKPDYRQLPALHALAYGRKPA